VRQAIQGGFADSKILDVHGQRMIDDSFVAGAHSTTQRKDMDQAIELALSLGLNLPSTTLNRDLYDQMIEAGHGNLDHAALIKAIDPDE
jgi:2-hydroxy-3-oxopropionate reductase